LERNPPKKGQFRLGADPFLILRVRRWSVKRLKLLLSLLLVALWLSDAGAKEVWVFCAMGMRDLAKDAANHFKGRVVFNFSSSGRLAKQIEEGASADVYLSANKRWVEYLKKKGLLVESSIEPVAKTQLVVIVPKDSKIKSLKEAKTIAVGDKSAPVGRYALEALKNLKLYGELKNRLVFAPNVRQVAVWVATGNADAGIVYLSDYLKFKKSVKLLKVLPEKSHSPAIFYGVAVKGGNVKEAKAFLNTLHSLPEREMERFGFRRP
jgi:molybdate transport system substrate-binding protein